MENKIIQALSWILEDLNQYENDAKKDYENDNTPFADGKVLAYYEMKEVIKNRLEALDIQVDFPKE